MRRILILSVAALALAACEPPAPGKTSEGGGAAAPAGAFASSQQDDLSGYYIPADQGAGTGWTFHHVFIGQASDFEAWEAGRRSATFAPIMIEFEDASSPMVQTEMGEQVICQRREHATHRVITLQALLKLFFLGADLAHHVFNDALVLAA